MKSTDLVAKLKELTGAKSNDEVLEAVEGLMPNPASAPFGLLIVMDPVHGGMYFPSIFRVQEDNELERLMLIHDACLNYTHNNIAPRIEALKEQALREKIKAELQAEQGGKDAD